MSVVVRMEMPEGCWDCPCLDDYGDYPRCRISEEQRGYKFPIREKRMPNCPIICTLPEGHGRLIDADKLKAKKYHSNITNENAVAVAEIDWAETIIPANVDGKRMEVQE